MDVRAEISKACQATVTAKTQTWKIKEGIVNDTMPPFSPPRLDLSSGEGIQFGYCRLPQLLPERHTLSSVIPREGQADNLVFFAAKDSRKGNRATIGRGWVRAVEVLEGVEGSALRCEPRTL